MNSRVLKKNLKRIVSIVIVLLLVMQIYVPVEAKQVDPASTDFIESSKTSPVRFTAEVSGSNIKIHIYDEFSSENDSIGIIIYKYSNSYRLGEQVKSQIVQLIDNQCDISVSVSDLEDGKYFLKINSLPRSLDLYFDNYGFDFNNNSGSIKFYSINGAGEQDYLNYITKNRKPKDYLDTSGYKEGIAKYDEIAATAKSITTNCRSDEEKVRAIHDWICSNISYSMGNNYGSVIANDSTPSWVYTNKIGGYHGITRLADVMLRSVGIPVIDIEGWNGLEEGRDYDENNIDQEWNLLYYNNSWHIFNFSLDICNTYYNKDDSRNRTGYPSQYVYYDVSPFIFGQEHISLEEFLNTTESKSPEQDEEFYDYEIFVGCAKELPSIDYNGVWSSSNSDVAVVNEWGQLIGVSPGTAKITASSTNGHKQSWNVKVSNGGFYGADGETYFGIVHYNRVNVGEQIDCSVRSDSEYTGYIYSSSNEDVATVDNKGVVTGVSPGFACISKVMLTPEGDYDIAWESIAVIDKAQTTYTPYATIKLGETYNLQKLVPHNDDFDKGVVWHSSKRDVGEIDNNTTFRAVGKGRTVLFAISSNGNSCASYIFDVGNESIIPDPTPSPNPTPSGDNVDSVDEESGTAVVNNAYTGGQDTVDLDIIEQSDIYRMYNPITAEHLYTKDAGEVEWLVGLGWNHETESDYAVVDARDDDAIPVYRLYNPYTDTHHYTESVDEVKYDVSVGWIYERISHYVYDKNSTKGTPQWRLYEASGAHNWTSDQGEISWLESMGWINEGIRWRVL